MIVHVLRFSFKEATNDADLAAIEAALGRLATSEAAAFAQIGQDLSDSEYTLTYCVGFENLATLERYMLHEPAHTVAVRAILPHVAKLAAVDFSDDPDPGLAAKIGALHQRRLDSDPEFAELMNSIGGELADSSELNENREKLRRMLEEVGSSGDYDVLDEYVHEDVVLPPHLPGAGEGRAGLKAALAGYDDVIEYQDVVEDSIAEGDKVVARIVARGKLKGDFLGLHGEGQEFTIDEMMIAQFRDGKISHLWRIADLFSLIQQVGGTVGQAT
jgi:ketosteroid isomerase-like protein